MKTKTRRVDAEDIREGMRIVLEDGRIAKVWGVSHHDSGPVVMSLTITTSYDEPARVLETDYAASFKVVAR